MKPDDNTERYEFEGPNAVQQAKNILDHVDLDDAIRLAVEIERRGQTPAERFGDKHRPDHADIDGGTFVPVQSEQWPCPHCDATFATEAQKNGHIGAVHSDREEPDYGAADSGETDDAGTVVSEVRSSSPATGVKRPKGTWPDELFDIDEPKGTEAYEAKQYLHRLAHHPRDTRMILEALGKNPNSTSKWLDDSYDFEVSSSQQLITAMYRYGLVDRDTSTDGKQTSGWTYVYTVTREGRRLRSDLFDEPTPETVFDHLDPEEYDPNR